MNATTDPRHLKRVQRIKSLFSKSFRTNMRTDADDIIQEYAPEWPLQSMNKVDLAILRAAVLELMQKKTPPKVVINEAINIAKLYGTESSAKFVNGVLATLVKKQDIWIENK